MKLNLIIGVCLLPLCVDAQTLASSPSSAPPIYVLYRLFFRDIAAIDAAAAKSDAAGLPGGAEARAWYQKSLLLTPAQAASATGPFTPPPQLVALEQERTAISNTCIQNLHTALGDRKFMDRDVFVRTRFAQKVSAIPPANAPFANVPIKPVSPGAVTGAAK